MGPLKYSDTMDLAVLVRWRHDPTMWVTYEELNTIEGVRVVPMGFLTDLASIPWIFRLFLPVFGNYTESAIVHDYYYSKGEKKAGDDVFKLLLELYGVKLWKIYILYRAVKWFGRSENSVQQFRRSGLVKVYK